MHSTSPGWRPHKNAVDESPPPPMTTHHLDLIDDLLLIRQNLSAKSGNNDSSAVDADDDCVEQIYDDPYELMMTDDWTSPVHIPRSRSWLCCPNGTGVGTNAAAAVETTTAMTTMSMSTSSAARCATKTRPINCDYTSLVTQQPKVSAAAATTNDPVNFKLFSH